MKFAKGIVFFLLIIMLGSCFNPPEFQSSHKLPSKILLLKEVMSQQIRYNILTLKFKDGDGDLELMQQPRFGSNPFHTLIFLGEGW